MTTLGAIGQYDGTQDTEVEWLSNIPAHWQLKRLKYVVEIVKRIAGKEGFDVLSITQKGIKVKDVESGEGQLAMDYSKHQLLYKGEFAMNHMDLLTGYVDISKYDGVVSPDYRVFRNRSSDVLDGYLLLIFQLGYTHRIFYKYGQGVSFLGRWRFPADNFNNFLIPIPPLAEQKKIINYITNKCALIEQAIALKDQQIALLKERKSTLIQHVVTRGVRTGVPLKESKLDWINKYPAGWEVKKFRYLFHLGKGLTITKENLQESGVPCVNYGEVHSSFGFELDSSRNDIKYVGEEYLKKGSGSLLNIGDFVFADTSEDIEGSGNFTYLCEGTRAFAGYHTVIARPKYNFLSRYIAYFFESLAYRQQVRRRVKGVKVYSITQSILKNTEVLIPSYEEQIEITQYLDGEVEKIKNGILSLEMQIDKLKEYRATLIHSAVTGKIKVA